jgi:hypothetical protein
MALSSDDSATNWPEAPAYSYSGLEAPMPWLWYVVMTTGGLLILAFAGLNALSASVPDSLAGWDGAPLLSIFVIARHDHLDPIIFVALAAIGVVSILVGIWMARFILHMRPGIALSADGVFAYLKDKPWRFIGWREIVSITRSTTIYKRHQYLSLKIRGSRYTIPVSEKIDRYADLRERLARYAHDHRVPLRASDGMSKVRDIAEL